MAIPLFELVGGAILVTELVLLAGRRSKDPRDDDRDRSSLRSMWSWILAGVAGAHVVVWTGIGPRFTLDPAQRLVALGLAAAGFVLRWWAVRVLGRWFTVDVVIRAGHELVTHGPFRLVRHPSYSGLAAMFVGWALTFQDVLAALVLLAPFGIVLARRMRIEERALEHAFPNAYPAYRTRTKRLLPFVY